MGVTDRERLLDSPVEETPATPQAPVALQPVVETSPPQVPSASLSTALRGEIVGYAGTKRALLVMHLSLSA